MILKIFLILSLPLLTACQVGYVLENAYHQARLLKRAIPIQTILDDENVNEETKNKLRLAEEAKQFAEKKLHLKKTKNYTNFVQLDGPYVTYVVSAAPRNELSYYTWYFPIVGSVPYKGFFNKEKAEKEALSLTDKNLDTYVRGVTAFSTLGWFRDPVLSSMTNYVDYDLVNTIIHETVHATIYISSNANFNERLATFLGDLGTKIFYEDKGEQGQQILKAVEKELSDQKKFSEFISAEIKELEGWYLAHQQDPDLLQAREVQFQKMKDNFKKNLLPHLQTDKYKQFDKMKINNARLMGFKLYMNDLNDFEKLAKHFNNNFEEVLQFCKSLEKYDAPEKQLKEFVKDKI